MPITRVPDSIDATLDLLAKADYIADRSLATVLYLALRMGRPLFLEGEAGPCAAPDTAPSPASGRRCNRPLPAGRGWRRCCQGLVLWACLLSLIHISEPTRRT